MSGQNLRGRYHLWALGLIASSLLGPTSVVSAAEAATQPAANQVERTAGTDAAGAPAIPARQRIEKLIQDLGSPRFTVRRSAANELRQIGAEAFDLLHAATDNSDPEIAASASYLLRQISIRWVRPEDPAQVRLVLRQYGQEADATRLERIAQLATLPQGAGVAALCRIARFDRAPLVSRTAALSVIRPRKMSRPQPAFDASLVEQELGTSTRPAVKWLREYLVQLRDPAASVASWKQLIDQEKAQLQENAADTSNEILLNLLWNLADSYRQIEDQQALTLALDEMLELAAETSDETIVNLLVWLSDNKSWDVLEAFLTKHQARISQSKRPLYYAALARAAQGKRELAEELATSAAELQLAQTPLESFAIAKDLEEHGQFEWAVREYRQAIDRQPPDSYEAILARIYLSALLHDYEREKEAADVLEPLVKAVQGDGKVSQLYAKIREYNAGRLALPKPEAIAAHYHFYRAGQYMAENDRSRARKSLDDAIEFDATDADVLIAMYHFPEADVAWRETVRQRIRQLAEQFQQEIEEDPTEASPYNQWAWLVSNTEGDFQKAIRYSHKSLELNTNGESGAASYLDTLGRCYYAAGEYQKAVEYERQAIEKVAYLQVMRRQLALFEKALAEKADAPQPAEKSN